MLKIFKNIKRKLSKQSMEQSKCDSMVVYNSSYGMTILFSFSEDNAISAAELLDSVNKSGLHSVMRTSSYDEHISKDDPTYDKDGFLNPYRNTVIHDKYYILIGGLYEDYAKMLNNTYTLDNIFIKECISHIESRCTATVTCFGTLIEDGIISHLSSNPMIDGDIVLGSLSYNNQDVFINNVPSVITGIDLLDFIMVKTKNEKPITAMEHLKLIYRNSGASCMGNLIINLYEALIKNLNADKIKHIITSPVYAYIDDDDGLPGSVSDDSLDELFRTQYERVNVLSDVEYTDIDDVISKERVNDEEE